MKKPTAVFIGYQTSDTFPAFALYNVIDPMNVTGRNHSTVGAKTLESLGIEIPETPEFKGGK